MWDANYNVLEDTNLHNINTIRKDLHMELSKENSTQL